MGGLGKKEGSLTVEHGGSSFGNEDGNVDGLRLRRLLGEALEGDLLALPRDGALKVGVSDATEDGAFAAELGVVEFVEGAKDG